MTLGTVKVWKSDQGYGFITEDDGADVFVHVKSLSGNLQKLDAGERVQFDKKQTSRGLQAVNVVIITDEASAVSASDVLSPNQFMREALEILPNLRPGYRDKMLEWGKGHGWVSDG
jgi:cold shock protein